MIPAESHEADISAPVSTGRVAWTLVRFGRVTDPRHKPADQARTLVRRCLDNPDRNGVMS